MELATAVDTELLSKKYDITDRISDANIEEISAKFDPVRCKMTLEGDEKEEKITIRQFLYNLEKGNNEYEQFG